MGKPRSTAGGALSSRSFTLLALGLLLVSAAPVEAQDGIYNVAVSATTTFNEENTLKSSGIASYFTDAVPGPDDGFFSRYVFNVNADTDPGEGGLNHSAMATFTIQFEVRSSQSYYLNVGVAFAGDLNRGNDVAGCMGSANISGVEGFSSQLVTGGSLNLPDPGPLFPDIISGDLPFFETTQALIRVRNPQATEFHTLTFSFEAGAFSDSCEVAVRLGAPNLSTASCAACEYPGDPPRDESLDGLSVAIDYIPLECGNGQLDAGEECDLGRAVNGFGSCCTPDCEFEEVNVPCDDHLFCNNDDRCDAAGVCTHPLGTPCQMGPEGNICFGVCDEATDSCDFSTCFVTPPPTATVPPTATASPIPTPTVRPPLCPLPYTSATLNVNGPNCAFCEVSGGDCSTSCVGPEACFCPDEFCCTERPCCANCPGANSPECQVNTCTCNPDSDDCCATVCGCAGDCNGDGGVTVNELVKGVRISRQESLPLECISFHTSRVGTVDTADIVRGVDIALTGCNAAP